MINKTTSRHNGLDLFRMLCMFMVVALHYFGHGGAKEALEPGTSNWVIGNIADCLSAVSVNGFFLLTGYFLCLSNFRVSKLLAVYT